MREDRDRDRLRRLKAAWEYHGRTDPLWAVLSADERKGGRWDVEAFLGTGRDEVSVVRKELHATGLDLPSGAALDFGCGAGRVTRALADHCQHVWGVDIAESMIDLARDLNRDIPNCTFLTNARPDLSVFGDESFDFVYSRIALMHVPTDIAKGYLVEFARVLRPNGILFAQLTSQPKSFLRRLEARVIPEEIQYSLRKLRHLGKPHYRLYSVPHDDVVALLTDHGVSAIRSIEDNAAGPRWQSFTYIAKKLR